MLWWVRPLLVRLLVMLNAIQSTQERFHLDKKNRKKPGYDNNDNSKVEYSMYKSSTVAGNLLLPRYI